MLSYSYQQWLLFFFSYAFLGWVWESCYCSIKSGHWINRGFLHGPMLPIYGFGAVIILHITLPFRQSTILTYLAGMLGATLLEYVTGYVMEKLFHTKYWDYSHQPFNLHGYICLFCSLGWGIFSLILVYLIHPEVERILIVLSNKTSTPLSLVIFVIFIIDVFTSVKEALDLKALLSSIEDINHRIEEISAQIEDIRLEVRKIHQTQNTKWKERVLEIWHEQNQRQFDHITAMKATIQSQLNGCLDQLKTNLSAQEKEARQIQKEQYLAFLNSLDELQAKIEANNDKKFRHALHITWRNPSMVSKRYSKALKLLLDPFKDRFHN